VAQIPTTFPAIYGTYALLKLLSDEGERSVYLLAISGMSKPWVLKVIPLGEKPAFDLETLKAETKSLSRMLSDNLPVVLGCDEIEGDVGIVMEYVPGKSLADICDRANECSMLLPPELGVIVAHDVFAAMELFHDFEGAIRAHGNISLRTILVSYAGEAKVAGYRPGCHARAEEDVRTGRDPKSIADILYELPFQMFPYQLAHLVPRLLDDAISPAEAMAAAKAFRRGHVPSADDRQKVATWLDEIFPGQRERDAKGHERLLAEGLKLIARPLTEPQVQTQSPAAGDAIDGHPRVRGEAGEAKVGRSTLFHRPLFTRVATGLVAALVLAAGIAWLMANRDRQAVPEVYAPEPATEALAAPADTGVHPDAALPDADSPAPVEVAAPVEVPVSQPELRPGLRVGHSAKRMPWKLSSRQLLDAANTAFDGGERIEAIKLAAQAVEAGGGVRAHLALGRYYRSLHRYREARDHYRTALQLEPGNKLAATGIEVIDKLLTPSP
jgi:hypothetical protein